MVCPVDKAPYAGLIVTEPDCCGVGGAPDGGGVLGGAGIAELPHPAALRIRQEIPTICARPSDIASSYEADSRHARFIPDPRGRTPSTPALRKASAPSDIRSSIGFLSWQSYWAP